MSKKSAIKMLPNQFQLKKPLFLHPAGKETLEFVDSLVLFANSSF